MSSRDPFTVSGAGEEGGAASVGAGISLAQEFARRHRFDVGEVSFYVRDGDCVGFAIVTKTAGGVIETDVSVSGRLEVSREEESTSPAEPYNATSDATGWPAWVPGEPRPTLELEDRGQLMFVHVE